MSFGESWLNDHSRQFLSRGYLSEGETPEDRIKEIAHTAEKYLDYPGFAAKFLEYMDAGYYSLASPIWANFGKKRALPISCFNSFIDDSVESILHTVGEVSMMSKTGGGTSGYFGELRPAGAPISSGGFSDGPMSFMRAFDTCVDVFKQGATRRGSFAAYMPIDHPDIMSFLQIRQEGCPVQQVFPGVCVKDAWLEQMISGDQEKQAIWREVLSSRIKTGTPYIFFHDNVNRNKPACYEHMDILSSNLCTEVLLPSNIYESFVCCLSSMNLLRYDEWVKTDAVRILTFFLDAVLTEFIEKAHDIPYMGRAVEFARNHRAIGIGALGWHSLLQSKMIPVESLEAQFLNKEIFMEIRSRSLEASKELGVMLGCPEICAAYGLRNSALMAIAPTTSSSFILGQISQSTELWRSNYYTKDLAKDKFVFKNPFLDRLLDEKPVDKTVVWKSILEHDGSVMHLDCLTDHEKNVFKTFSEVSQKELIIQAAQRQKFIDQGQSLNMMVHPSHTLKEINQLVLFAWEQGIKTLYYQHSINGAQDFYRSLSACTSCEA